MIQLKVEELRRRKAYQENRKITLRVMAEETGLSLQTVHRINGGNVTAVELSTLNALCQFFKVQSISELMEYVPDSAGGAT